MCKVAPYNIVDSYIYEQNKGRINSSWEVVWEDQFENPQLDTTKWTRIPRNNADWGRHMTDDPICYAIANGKLYSQIAAYTNQLIIPKSSVLWTGKRAVVFVKVPERENPTFIYREIILGPQAGNSYVAETVAEMFASHCFDFDVRARQ